MRKLLNVLYVTSPDAYIGRDGENIVVTVKDKDAFRIPIHNLEGVVTFGYTDASPAVMALCAERGVSLVRGEGTGRQRRPRKGDRSFGRRHCLS